MPISSNSRREDGQTDLAVDCNTSSTTTPLNMGEATLVGLCVIADTGTHTTHKIRIQVSPNNSDWLDTEKLVTGVGHVGNLGVISKWVRCKVTTLEGAASTCDVYLTIK